jgi:hypothetical protein
VATFLGGRHFTAVRLGAIVGGPDCPPNRPAQLTWHSAAASPPSRSSRRADRSTQLSWIGLTATFHRLRSLLAVGRGHSGGHGRGIEDAPVEEPAE